MPGQGLFQLPNKWDLPDQFMPGGDPLARMQAFSMLLRKEKYRWTGGRRFVVLENGLIGIGPGTAREGDLVIVLAGASVPYVIRPFNPVSDDERFEFVGER
jgi:hypothetical protein